MLSIVPGLATAPPNAVTEMALTANELYEEALTRFEAGDLAGAIQRMQESLAKGAASTERWNTLGNLLAHAQRFNEAASAFRRALGRSPRSASIWNNLGAVLLRDQHVVGAECAFRRAISLQESFHEAHQNLALLLDGRGDTLEAARHHCLAFVHGPRAGKTPAMLGTAYYHLGQFEEAARVYRDWVLAEPENPVARHRLAACLNEDVPTRGSDDFVEQSFDAFAPHFDDHLAGLAYCGPETVAAAVARVRPVDASARILDVGCGTGLCGTVLRPLAAQLDGVDLSSGMLDRARVRGCYDRLEKVELTGFLESCRSAYDVVVAADTFNYFGDLAPVFRAAAQALEADGHLVFTIEDGREACPEQGWCLAVHGRYLHAPATIEAWLQAAGFAVHHARPLALRRELGQDVAAVVYTAQRVGHGR